MNIENFKIKSIKDWNELQNYITENPSSFSDFSKILTKDYFDLSEYLSILLSNYIEPHDSSEYVLVLEEMTFKFYTHYNSIIRLGSMKTEIYDNRLVLDDQSIGVIVRVMIEIIIIMKFIYGTRISNPELSKFRFNVWKYCDLIYNQNSIIGKNPYFKNTSENNSFEKLLTDIKLSPIYIKISDKEKKAINKANWSLFLGNLLTLAEQLEFSKLFKYFYANLSTHIHSSYLSLTGTTRFSKSVLRHDNYNIYLGIAGNVAKELFILFIEINNSTILKINEIYDLELVNKIESWIEDKKNLLHLETELK